MKWFSRRSRPAVVPASRRPVRPAAVLWLEVLEERTLFSAAAGVLQPVAVVSARHQAALIVPAAAADETVASRPARATRAALVTRVKAAAPAAATPTSTQLATLSLKPLDVNLLGLEVKTGAITITLSTQSGNGELLGNLLHATSGLVNLQDVSTALNRVLGSTIDLLNSASLSVGGVGAGALTTLAAGTTPVVNLSVAPVHLNLLGVNVDTSPIAVSLIAHSGTGLVLGNVVSDLAHLFDPPLPAKLDLNTINAKLQVLLSELNQQIPGIAPAPVPTVQPAAGQVANLTVPPIDLNLLGLGLQTSPITVSAVADVGNGLLLGNVLTSALYTLGATPQALADLSNNLNGVLAEVVGVLNAGTLKLSASGTNALPPILKTLLSPTLTAPAAGSTAQVLNLMIASGDGVSPPVDVNLMGLDVTTGNVKAVLTATTGDGQVLGNLLYNVANLANPGAPAALLNLFNQLGAGANSVTGTFAGLTGALSPAPPAAQQLLQVNLKPLDVNLLGLEVKTDPIAVTVSTQAGGGELLGNLLGGITTLLNVPAVNNALNNVLATAVNLANSASLSVTGVGAGLLSTADVSSTNIVNLMVSPVHLNLLGLLVDTSTIHLTITANAGPGNVLGNVVSDLAHLFDPPLPAALNLDAINAKLATLLAEVNQQIPGIAPAPVPTVHLTTGQVASLTVPPIDLNLLGLVLQTSPVTVNAADQTGSGLLLGNVLTTALNTLGATPANLGTLSNDLNAVLAKVVGVLNASALALPAGALAALPGVLQTLASPTLVTSSASAATPVLDLVVASPGGGSTPPVDVNLLGLDVTTSNVTAHLSARTGTGQVLGNLVYNIANLLNGNEAATLLSVLGQVGQLGA